MRLGEESYGSSGRHCVLKPADVELILVQPYTLSALNYVIAMIPLISFDVVLQFCNELKAQQHKVLSVLRAFLILERYVVTFSFRNVWSLVVHLQSFHLLS